MQRPTIGEIAEAREHCRDAIDNDLWPNPSQVDVLLAATEPPTDAEIIERYNALLKRKGWRDAGNAVWFADGIEAFLGRTRPTCVCGRCPAKP